MIQQGQVFKLNTLTRVLADELRGSGILVNVVCPGWIATDMGGPGSRPVEVGAARVLWAVLLADDGPTGGFFAMGGSFPGELAAGSEVSTESTTRSVGWACSRMSLDESPSPVRDRRRIDASGSRRCRSPPDEPCKRRLVWRGGLSRWRGRALARLRVRGTG